MTEKILCRYCKQEVPESVIQLRKWTPEMWTCGDDACEEKAGQEWLANSDADLNRELADRS